MAWVKKGTYRRKAAHWIRGYAVSHEWHLDSNDTGLRVVLMEWEDHPHEAKLIKGDGRTPHFQILAEGIVPPKEE